MKNNDVSTKTSTSAKHKLSILVLVIAVLLALYSSIATVSSMVLNRARIEQAGNEKVCDKIEDLERKSVCMVNVVELDGQTDMLMGIWSTVSVSSLLLFLFLLLHTLDKKNR